MKSRVFVNAAATIGHQPVFGVTGFVNELKPLQSGDELIQPSYRDYIDPMSLRRMSKILRMSLTSAKEALRQAAVEIPSGIIVGTGLGCLVETEKFLTNFLTLEGLIPPTAFILSTHNTIAGQISLSLNCHNYNITHTQNTVSFEIALVDGIMKLEEGEDNLLVGAADEHIPFLDRVASEWGYAGLRLTSGTSFFVLSSMSSSHTKAEIIDVEVVVNKVEHLDSSITRFLDRLGLKADDLDVVLESGWKGGSRADTKKQGFIEYSGFYPTASAFAFHYAVDYLQTVDGAKYVLVVNDLNPNNLGLVLLKSVEI